MALKRTQELEALIAQRDSEITNLKQYIQAISKQVEEYQQKERAIGQAFTEAQAAANARIEEAEQRALGIVAVAEQQRDEILTQAEATLNEANEKAAEIIEAAQLEAMRRVQQTEASVADYEARLKNMNAALSELAHNVQQEAGKFSQFLLESETAPDREFLSQVPHFAPEAPADEEAADEEPIAADDFFEAEDIEKTLVLDRAELNTSSEERVWTTDEIVGDMPDSADDGDGLDQLLDEILQSKQ